jgi:hypothetical protein
LDLGATPSPSIRTSVAESSADRLRSAPPLSGKYRDDAPHYVEPALSAVSISESSFLAVPKPSKPSPLHLAIMESYIEGVRLLANHQDKLSRLGSTAQEKIGCLKTACEGPNIDIALILMRMLSKASLNEVFLTLLALPLDAIHEYLKTTFPANDIYLTHISKAISWGTEELLPKMMELWPLRDANKTTIHTAVQNNLGLVKMFLESGVPLSQVLMEDSASPLLHLVIQVSSRNLDLVRLLIDKGANVDTKNHHGETPLLALIAMSSTESLLTVGSPQPRCLEVAKILVSHGADVHVLDERKRGLCHKAASSSEEDFLNWALETLKLNPNSRDENSRTPLLLAVENGQIGAVRLLLRHLLPKEDGNGSPDYERVVDAMEYANMRSAPLLRAMVARSTRQLVIVTALVEADELAFRSLNHARQSDLAGLRTAFYLEALTWSSDCDFPTAFTFLLPKISKATLASRTNMDGDGIFHVAAAAQSNEYLKTLLLMVSSQEQGEGEALHLTNAQRQIPLDVVIESVSADKYELLLLHRVKPTEAQLSKARAKRIPIVEATTI